MRDIPEVYDLKENSDRCALFCMDASRTKQADLKDADINEIVRKFGLNGQMPVGFQMPSFGDFTGVDDFRTAMDAIRNADVAFMSLPHEMRARFGNDPQLLMEFLGDENNRVEAEKLGLLNKLPEIMPIPGVDSPIRVIVDGPKEPVK